jgi:hypothetical protein
LPFTNDPEAAQRIAMIVLQQGRLGCQIELVLNHNAMQFAVWDTVTYTDPYLGWNQKVFRIRKFSSAGIGPVTLLLQEESSDAYSWDTTMPTVLDAAPGTSLPNPFIVSAISGLSYSSRSITTPGGDTVYNLVASWTLNPDIFVQQGGEIEIQYKLHTDSTWRPSFFVKGNLTMADILSSAVNVNYDIRLRAISSLGGSVRSNWTELDNCIIGTSGGVGATNDWGIWTGSVSATLDWGDWTHSPGATQDWGAFT